MHLAFCCHVVSKLLLLEGGHADALCKYVIYDLSGQSAYSVKQFYRPAGSHLTFAQEVAKVSADLSS